LEASIAAPEGTKDAGWRTRTKTGQA
jgi:hypothetical protein